MDSRQHRQAGAPGWIGKLALALFVPLVAQAQTRPSDIEIASQYVAKKAEKLQQIARYAPLNLSINGNSQYKVGQTWRVVAAIPILDLNGGGMRALSEAAQVRSYDFKVVSVSAGVAKVNVSSEAADLATIEISQNAQVVSAKVIRHGVGLDLFPVNVPRLTVAEADASEATAIPALPSPIKQYSAATQGALSGEHAVEFQAQDMFGRPVQVIWRDRDPWPIYMSSRAGVSILESAISRGSGP